MIKIPLSKRRMIIHAIIFFVGLGFEAKFLYVLFHKPFPTIFVGLVFALLLMSFFLNGLYLLIYLYKKGYSAQLDEQGITVAGWELPFKKNGDRFIPWPDVTAVRIEERGRHGPAVVIKTKESSLLQPISGFKKWLRYLKMLSYNQRKNRVVLEYCQPEPTYEMVDKYWKQYR